MKQEFDLILTKYVKNLFSSSFVRIMKLGRFVEAILALRCET